MNAGPEIHQLCCRHTSSDRAMIRADAREDDMQNADDKKLDRRSFLQAAGVVAGSALASSALSYDRIRGANDRIALGHIGIGNRGGQLHLMASRLKDKHNVETVAVCDLWM